MRERPHPAFEQEAAPQRKRLNLEPAFAATIIRGQNTKTWPLFDATEIEEGDEVDCYDSSDPAKPIARILVQRTWDKRVRFLDEQDSTGHEPLENRDEMLRIESARYYEQCLLNPDTIVRVVEFEIL